MIDEITPIADYITLEMITNAGSEVVRRMNELNRFNTDQCIADYQKLPIWKQLFGLGLTPNDCIDMAFSTKSAALLLWAEKVRQNGDWDHKPKIAKKFHPRNAGGEQHWHLYDKTLYYYDVWSNIHYGYVGKAGGFSDSELLDGAGLEQIGSTLIRFSRPQRDKTVSGLRAYDDPSDREGIEIGIQLYRTNPGSLTKAMVLNKVLSSTRVETKPYRMAIAR